MIYDPLATWAAKWNIPQAALNDLPSHYHKPLEIVPGGSEAMVQAGLRVTAPKYGNALWRNNSGGFTDDTGRFVRYGLNNESKKLNEVWKSPDLVGITKVIITPLHFGRTLGIFTGIEVKEEGWKGPRNAHEKAQANCLTNINSLGGIGMFISSVKQYEGIFSNGTA